MFGRVVKKLNWTCVIVRPTSSLKPLVKSNDLPIPQICRKTLMNIQISNWKRSISLDNELMSNSNQCSVGTFSFSSNTPYIPLVHSFHTVFWIPLAEIQGVLAQLHMIKYECGNVSISQRKPGNEGHKESYMKAFLTCWLWIVIVRIAKYLVCQTSELKQYII